MSSSREHSSPEAHEQEKKQSSHGSIHETNNTRTAVVNGTGESLSLLRSKQHPKELPPSFTARIWSTSNDWKGRTPELTSNRCFRALHDLFHYTDEHDQNPLLALAAESSSHPSGLLTLFAQPYVYAGGGLGNVNECPREMMQSCLAGGNKRDSLTFASVCIVPECTALDLASPDFVGVLELASGIPETRSAVGTSYVQLHTTIAELNKFLKTGWTCGEFHVQWKPFPFGLPYLMLLCAVTGLSLIASCGLNRKRRAAAGRRMKNGSCLPVPQQQLRLQQEEYFNDHEEEKKDQSAPSTYNGPIAPNDTEDSQRKEKASLLQAWNVPTHLKRLTRHRADTAALDGLRVMSILWVILGHVMAIQSSSGGGYNNPRDFLPPHGLTTKLGGQLLFASRFAVDTFLVLSGYLVVCVLLAKMPTAPSDISGSLWFVQNYFHNIPGLLLHRILRIMPLYAMTLGFWTQVAPFLGSGPFWYQWEPLLESCREYGWTNLLFVNNFFPWNLANTETCFYHSWYLAVDVQLFVLAPLLVGWYRQSRANGQMATGILLFLSVAMTVYLSFARKWSLNTFDGASVARFDVEGYAKPHVRAQSYLSGMLLAMWMNSSSCSRRCSQTPTWKHRMAMVFALASLAFVTFCTVTGAYSRRPCRYVEWPFLDECGSTWSTTATFLYTGISRAVWALGIVVIMILCLNQQGGLVGDFLSWKGWTPLSNLSFGAYLVHPIVIFVWQLGNTQKETFRLLAFGMNYVSVCVVSFAASLLLSLLIELPCATLVRQYGRRLFSRCWKSEKAARNMEEDLIQLLSNNKTAVETPETSYQYGSVGAESNR